MAYIKNNLIKGETIEQELKLHWWYWFGVFLNIIFIITIPFAIHFIIRGLTLEQVITNKRLIVKSGLIARKVEELKLAKVETVEIKQGILGRILGFGKLKLTGAGSHNTLTTILIKDPVKAKNIIDEIID